MKSYIDIVYDKERTPVSDYPAALVRYLIEKFKVGMPEILLEIGCGRGDFLEAFRQTGLTVKGVDRVHCNNLPDSLNISACNILKDKIPLDDESVGVVYHKSLIEHLIEPDNLMTETLRVLKKGGCTIILTPDWESQSQVFYEDYTHVKPYMVDALKDLLDVYGFKDIVVEKFYQLPCLWKRPYLAFISKLFSAFVTVKVARKLSSITGIKWFRFSKETMLLAYGRKEK